MKWSKVRELYPNQFVKFKVIESHEENNYKYVDDIEVIKAIKDGREPMSEFIRCKNGELVYSTVNEDIVIEKVKNMRTGRRI